MVYLALTQSNGVVCRLTILCVCVCVARGHSNFDVCALCIQFIFLHFRSLVFCAARFIHLQFSRLLVLFGFGRLITHSSPATSDHLVVTLLVFRFVVLFYRIHRIRRFVTNQFAKSIQTPQTRLRRRYYEIINLLILSTYFDSFAVHRISAGSTRFSFNYHFRFVFLFFHNCFKLLLPLSFSLSLTAKTVKLFQFQVELVIDQNRTFSIIISCKFLHKSKYKSKEKIDCFFLVGKKMIDNFEKVKT